MSATEPVAADLPEEQKPDASGPPDAEPVIYEVSAPLRPNYPGLNVAGYHWPTMPSTRVEVTDNESDGPHEGDLRRLCRKTWSIVSRAASESRLFVRVFQGDRAEADAKMIAGLGEKVAALDAQIHDLQVTLQRERAVVEPLRAQQQADAAVVAELRAENDRLIKAEAEAQRRAKENAQAQARSEQKAAELVAEVKRLEEQLERYSRKSKGRAA